MFEKVKKFVVNHKLTSALTAGAAVLGSAMPAFAAESPLVNVTSDMLSPITNSITSNMGVLLPVGITIMAILIGVSLIPRIIYKFF